ncbi:hypothetical protein LCGC14_2757390 [marine sediment metagenome]|uniref:Tyrosine specific protein phosphatases domain-containing protein n=1 Tax=marine sediment metagenome TaxID=412755 RepID=A0A0F8Z025_9ZZZZ
MRKWKKQKNYTNSCQHWRQPVMVGKFLVTCSSGMYFSLGRNTEPHPGLPYPDFGVYLDSRWKAKVDGHYPALITHWPDMKAPKPEELTRVVDICLSKMSQGKVIDIGCMAGHGRTGTLLASLIAKVEHLDGVTALREARWRYCSYACETRDQREAVINYAKRCSPMKRTISQLVYDLLDREGLLPATEIAKKLGIKRGTACSARDRWKKSLRFTHRRPRIVDVNIPSAKKVAPAEVLPCACINKLVEKGFVERETVYENQDFVDKGYLLRKYINQGKNSVATNRVFGLNYCPACGQRLR